MTWMLSQTSVNNNSPPTQLFHVAIQQPWGFFFFKQISSSVEISLADVTCGGMKLSWCFCNRSDEKYLTFKEGVIHVTSACDEIYSESCLPLCSVGTVGAIRILSPPGSTKYWNESCFNYAAFLLLYEAFRLSPCNLTVSSAFFFLREKWSIVPGAL